jgi:hypothetical protein
MQAEVNMTSISGFFLNFLKNLVALTKIEYRRRPAASHVRNFSILYGAAPSGRVSRSYFNGGFSVA